RLILPTVEMQPSGGRLQDGGLYYTACHPQVLKCFPNVSWQGHLHDRYGQLVNIYTKLLLTKISFHLKHPEFPPGLEVTDEVLEKAAGTDVNNIFQLTVEMFDYMDCELRLTESVFRQLNTAMAVSQMSAVQCRLAPLIQVIQDCSHLYHYTVKLMFKLHSCLPADTLQGHRDRFHEQFRSLKNFFKRASDMLYFKRLIQIPRLPESPPNFLRASALAEHVKPVVVIPEEAPEDEEPENLIEISTAPQVEQQNVPDIFEQTFGPPNGVRDDRDLQIENLKKEVDLLRAELEKIKLEVRRGAAVPGVEEEAHGVAGSLNRVGNRRGGLSVGSAVHHTAQGPDQQPGG
uniref:AP180 N-terminal homology (ANTH) domain-containing protein n=1 Tax=Pelusios castaneus TaxID=367368 RepID=A0A8C8VMV8_9SAUR